MSQAKATAVRLPEPDVDRSSAAAESTRLGLYLRQLREGYGYTLRKVEERALEMGEAIDNSQLSRFEKGKAIPSFDKLRALARVFNVPVQNFSDVLDLQEFEHLKPTGSNYAELLRQGADALARGEHGLAFVTYERAMEMAESIDDPERSLEMAVEARWRMATALKLLGKLYMTERELRGILKRRRELKPRARRRTLLQLSFLYRELGDLYLASVLARESLTLAEAENDPLARAGVLNTLANIAFDEDDPEAARGYYEGARTLLEGVNGHREMLVMVLTNLGGCLVRLGRFDDGVAMLDEAHTRARQEGFRRAAALSLTRKAEAFMERDDHRRARRLLDDSDALSSRADDAFEDLLFLNTFHRWSMARRERHATRERIAFGRLRHLRSRIQRRFPEVEEFDRHIERSRR